MSLGWTLSWTRKYDNVQDMVPYTPSSGLHKGEPEFDHFSVHPPSLYSYREEANASRKRARMTRVTSSLELIELQRYVFTL